MALFAVNTGCRDAEICDLLWEWEVAVRELETSSLSLGARVKNGDERLVVLNRVAKSVIEARRGIHPEYVFTYKGRPIRYMLNSGWRSACVCRTAAGSRPRPEAHVWPPFACGRRELRGSARSAGASLGSYHDALFGGGTFSIDRSRQQCVRAERTRPELLVLRGALEGRPPQNSRKSHSSHHASSAKWLRSLAGMPGFEPGNGGIKIVPGRVSNQRPFPLLAPCRGATDQ